MKKHFSKIFYLSIKPSIFYFIARASNACLVIKEAMNTSTLWINCYTKTDTLKFEDYQEKRNKRIIACKTLPGYLKSDFVERIARLQWGALKEPARAPVDLVAAMHWSIRLSVAIGPYNWSHVGHPDLFCFYAAFSVPPPPDGAGCAAGRSTLTSLFRERWEYNLSECWPTGHPIDKYFDPLAVRTKLPQRSC